MCKMVMKNQVGTEQPQDGADYYSNARCRFCVQ